VFAALAGGVGASAHAKQRDAAVAPAPAPAMAADATSPEQRLIEARQLLRKPDDRAARQRVAQLLARGPTEPEAAALLTAMQEGVPVADAPAWFGALSLMANDPQRAKNPLVLGALSSFRTRDSARVLLRSLSMVDETARPMVYASLARLSGRDDLGEDAAAWSRWFAEAERQSESQWRSSLLDGLGSRADRLNAARESALSRLAEGYSRLHLATPPEQRSELLASMLADPLAAVCAQGMELVSRELAATNRLDASVGAAAVAVLSRPEAELRASAALLVNQLVPEGAADAVRRALARESDPRAAAALLQTATRWPSTDTGDAALTWIASATPARGAACDAAWSLLRAGVLTSDQQNRTLVLLRELRPAERPAAACHVLAWLGDESDRRSLSPLLASLDASQRLATAEALGPYPEFLTEILDAAARDPVLLNAALRAVVLHDQSVRGFAAMNRLSAGNDARRGVLVSAASVLAANDLLVASRSLAGDPMQESVLAQFASPVRLMSERVDPARRESLAQGLVLLARRRIELDLPAEALAALDQLPSLGPVSESAASAGELARLRIVALLMLGRVDAAAEADDAPPSKPGEPDVSAWLEGLERSVGKPHAAAVLDAVRSRVAPVFDDAQKQRFTEISARIAR